MSKIGLFYGSDTGVTEEYSQKIQEAFSKEVVLHNIADSSVKDIESYDKLIFASSTWGEGDLQADWEDFEDNLSDIDFSNKTIALMGVGDQDTYGETFCDALGHLYSYIKDGNLIGKTSTDGYDYEESTAVVDGEFVGLILDDTNQDDLTDERIEAWVKQIEPLF